MARRATAVGGRDCGPSVRRAYFECRFGQLHVHNAMPAGGGFDEATPLLCIHRDGVTGRMFAGLMRTIGRDRSVYAPDLPGSGESDGPQPSPGCTDLAAALGDFLRDLRLHRQPAGRDGAPVRKHHKVSTLPIDIRRAARGSRGRGG